MCISSKSFNFRSGECAEQQDKLAIDGYASQLEQTMQGSAIRLSTEKKAKKV